MADLKRNLGRSQPVCQLCNGLAVGSALSDDRDVLGLLAALVRGGDALGHWSGCPGMQAQHLQQGGCHFLLQAGVLGNGSTCWASACNIMVGISQTTKYGHLPLHGLTAESVQDDIHKIMTGVAATVCHCDKARSAAAAGRVRSQPNCLSKRPREFGCAQTRLLRHPPATSRCYLQVGFQMASISHQPSTTASSDSCMTRGLPVKLPLMMPITKGSVSTFFS